jgi:hypothetical protein
MLKALEEDDAGQTVVGLKTRLCWRHEDAAWALRALEADGKAHMERQPKSGKGGRPAEIWKAGIEV